MQSKFLCLICALFSFIGCYDDDKIWQQMGEFDERLTEVELAVKELNETTVPNIQAIIEALNGKVYVSSVTENVGGGYTINFTNGTSATIKDGDKGDTPQVGVTTVEDEYYWTINGEILKNSEGNMIPVHAAKPMFRVLNGKFQLSYNGENWSEIEKTGDGAAVIKVVEQEDYVLFVIDGVEYKVEKSKKFALHFDVSMGLGVVATQELDIPYSLTGVLENDTTEVGVLGAPTNWVAEAVATDNKSGNIIGKVSEQLTGKIHVYASNGRGSTDIKALVFEEGKLSAEFGASSVQGEGGQVKLYVTTNTAYEIQIPADTTWISLAPDTKSLRVDTLVFNVEENTTGIDRSVDLSLVNAAGFEVQKVSIYQDEIFDFETYQVTAAATPFFSDAKISWNSVDDERVSGYAVYVDGAADPIILANSDTTFCRVGDGQWGINTPHTVQVALVDKYNRPVESTKSEVLSFNTANITQNTTAVGPTTISVAWDDVSGGGKTTKNRLFYVELFEQPDTASTPLYSLYTFNGQYAGEGALGGSSWVGKKNNSNLAIPTRASFGFLKPNTEYYFRVRTTDPITVGEIGLNYTSGVKETNSLCSKTGGSPFSQLFAVKTEPAHVAEPNEVIFQGFDDFALQGDVMNHAIGCNPLFEVMASASAYDDVVGNYKYPWDGKYTFHAFSKVANMKSYGMVDENLQMTDNAGPSLKGWSLNESASVAPMYGYVRIGNSSSDYAIGIVTPELTENLTDEEQICTVSFDACPVATNADYGKLGIRLKVDYLIPNGTGDYRSVSGKMIVLEESRTFTDTKNYEYHPKWEKVTTQVKLAKGYKVRIRKADGSNITSRICVDNISICVAPEGTEYTGAEDLVSAAASEADGTNYDVYDLDGKFPILSWWAPPATHCNLETYTTMKESGINVMLNVGEVDTSVEANKTILGFCEQLGMKYMGATGGWEASYPGIAEYANSDAYIGQYAYDEPNAEMFDYISIYADQYGKDYPDKIFYVNLYPCYANPTNQLRASSYEEYVDKWLATKNVISVSFDFYPIKSSHAIRMDYFYNLDLVRAKTLAKRLPFMMIGIGGDDYTTPLLEEEFRWNIWTAIAYGSKGYSYFCYWTPVGFGNMMVDREGNPTQYYDYVKNANAAIEPIGKKLLPCHADGVIQASSEIIDSYAPRTSYGPVLKAEGENAIIGCFRQVNDGSYKLFVTNQQIALKMAATPITTIYFDETVKQVDLTYTTDVTTTVTQDVVDSKLTLNFAHGEACLVEIKN